MSGDLSGRPNAGRVAFLLGVDLDLANPRASTFNGRRMTEEEFATLGACTTADLMAVLPLLEMERDVIDSRLRAIEALETEVYPVMESTGCGPKPVVLDLDEPLRSEVLAYLASLTDDQGRPLFPWADDR